jgi:hypothetical protein
MTNRTDCKTLLAKQVAIFSGHIWAKLPDKIKDRYLTLAEIMLATVERKQTSYNWNSPQRPDGDGLYLR